MNSYYSQPRTALSHKRSSSIDADDYGSREWPRSKSSTGRMSSTAKAKHRKISKFLVDTNSITILNQSESEIGKASKLSMSRNSHRSAKFRRARSYKAETLDSEGPAICDQEQSLEEALEGALNYFSADYSAAFAQAKKRRQAKEQEMEFLKTSHSSEIEAIRGQVASKDRKFAQYQKSLDKANAEAYNSTIQLKAAQKTIVAKDNEIYKLQNDIKDLEAQLKNCGVMLTKERFTNETFAIAYRATSAKTRRPQSGYAHTTKSSQDWSRGTVQSPSRIKMPSPFAQRSDTMNSSFITST